eukprot:TRINITY_DN19739_c0_g1_i1.p1 TRINITY_DN19739_c0_g1~~TRINITY_DN19739_c0_g1_i1.p1  ORF type:complete len:202 (-),score=20.84 TRINITY_DN19739_c0_g1_i1:23-628(-)
MASIGGVLAVAAVQSVYGFIVDALTQHLEIHQHRSKAVARRQRLGLPEVGADRTLDEEDDEILPSYNCGRSTRFAAVGALWIAPCSFVRLQALDILLPSSGLFKEFVDLLILAPLATAGEITVFETLRGSESRVAPRLRQEFLNIQLAKWLARPVIHTVSAMVGPNAALLLTNALGTATTMLVCWRLNTPLVYSLPAAKKY